MMKKVGIITFHRALNFGAVLQAFALQRFIEALGCDVEILDYYPPFLKNLYKKNPKRPYNLVSKCYYRKLFTSFIKQNLNLSAACFEKKETLTDYVQDFDFVVTGSDTVWSSQITGLELPTYLLDFVPYGVKRIAYAASMGGGGMNSITEPIFRNELPKFTAIALREPDFCDQVAQIAGMNVVDVSDPTLLLDVNDYSSLMHPIKNMGKYMVLFDLANDPFIKQLAVKISKIRNLKIVNLAGRYERCADINLMKVSPERWLSYISAADFVCTNSFHATAFAIIFRREFVTAKVMIGQRAGNNVRAVNVLRQLGLEDRYIDSLNTDITGDIDYSIVEERLDMYRTRSVSFLKKIFEHEN